MSPPAAVPDPGEKPAAAPLWRRVVKAVRNAQSNRAFRRSLVAAINLPCLLIASALVNDQIVTLAWAGHSLAPMPGFLVPFVGYGLGMAGLYGLRWSPPATSPTTTGSDPMVALRAVPRNALFWRFLIGFWVVVIVGAAIHAFKGWTQAGVVLLCGSAAAPFIGQTIRRISAGESFAVESHWGGLGGGLGGWRLSPLTTAALLALILMAATGFAALWTGNAPPVPPPQPKSPAVSHGA